MVKEKVNEIALKVGVTFHYSIYSFNLYQLPFKFQPAKLMARL